MKRFAFGRMYKQIFFIPAVGIVKRSNIYHFKRYVSFGFLNFGVCFKYRLRDNSIKTNRTPYNGKRLRIDIFYDNFSFFPSFGMRFLPAFLFDYKYSLCFAWGYFFMCYKFGRRKPQDNGGAEQ